MMKSIQIGLEWFPEQGGGLDRYYHDCCQYLPQADINITGLLAGSDKVIRDSQGKVTAFASPNDPLLQRWLKMRQVFSQTLVKDQYDLIVSHFALYTFPILNQLKALPLVIHFHGPFALESDVETQKNMAVKVKKLLEKSVYKRSQHFIVLSQTFRDVLHQEYQVPLERIQVIPGGVDIDRFNISLSPAEARQQLSWHLDRPIIFCIRRLAKRMGLENLITAMIKVRSLYPDVLLYIAGKGALAETLETQITELELTNNVKLLGYVPDEQLPLYYRAANFSVVPTIALEGFGLIVVESLAAGTPVLGTPIGGIPEILRPFSEDLVFEGCHQDQLATGIIEVLSGDRILPSSQDCLDYVEANYNWKAIAQQIKAVYQQAIV
jgi:glycosyltransferase involved in cell wall biosynthesis